MMESILRNWVFSVMLVKLIIFIPGTNECTEFHRTIINYYLQKNFHIFYNEKTGRLVTPFST